MMDPGSLASSLGAALGVLKPTKAKLKCVGSNLPSGVVELECMFNPTEYRIAQSAQVSRNNTAAKAGGTADFSGTGPITLTLQLFFDAFAATSGNVAPQVNTLMSWTRPVDGSTPPAPPQVSFKWGGNQMLNDFHGFLRTVSANYTIFRTDGTPVQARVDLTIEGDTSPLPGQNPTSRSIDSRRTHMVVSGDTLQSVAFAELGRPTYWRAIADLNGIDDPLRVPTGTVLLIPTAADAARSS
jgi:nucleoid-associated protein YgaU